ncbi:MAG TPA: bifunctional GNAT family N-acetyltransferase/carbon-nitrogen hydrolase family protein [Bacteroides mediterraneensis]|uniref:carbon-nitrogen hydrolase family protein n=1 Tax=Bacteroidaceae TaxID=815 RepID=UPI000932E98D|nr:MULTISPECIES: bifunctional GNAT family N-acetyltransferase/carbon-nitrogen hydrolase family protein [Bacteroidaceae]MBM6656807.1 bifunctional GNAT family N-acetyltransferase/carbon-nitrogen hydrolase family protein [Bacteroides mediterraneensis]MDR3795319.1 bifunctional GNAT family N-acetyltransferase/carbon-nitrogen hydrolase family protein [Phocaeicola sp.]HJH63489.1 bifunctional GNAT family N-acetyltransferase/carbon-nitrogen hydrolase family protein [Bacteroides mediterraneensis]
MEPTQKKINKVELRNLQIEDYAQLAQSFTRVYADKDVFWTHAQIEKLIRIFPEGQIVTVVDDKIVGCALSIIVDYDLVKGDHTYAKVTGDETFSTHNPKGNILYGIEVFIHPEYRGLRLARRMYEYRKELCEKLNLKAIMFGGRIPNYYKYADQMRPKEYIEKVRSREIYDPVLTFQLSNDFHVRRVMRNYLPNDEESKHCATLLQWDNIYYQPPTDSYIDKKTTVRVGLVQWQMRSYQTLDDVFEQVEFFIDAVAGYKSDFVLFPEYFNAPLMAKFNNMGEAQSIRALAQYTEDIRDRFINLAIKHNINIITGSMPYVKEDGGLYNVGFLCRRDGTYEMYEKIHVTPDEVKSWGLSGGKKVQTFDTDCAKIGVLICYDVEFPELSRLMADQGMQILFVPFLTDTQNGYSRVRVCAQARAIENECFVVIAGSVGNLPRVHNMDIQYAQSGVFTPCDFAFPTDGKRAEATPNTEMILVSDVDLDLLNELHTYGSVRNLRDRRNDLYELRMKKNAQENN